MFETVEEALEYLGDEARNVYEEGADEPWELQPEHAGDDPAWYEWCDDCETYHTNHYPIGYEVTKGCVEMVVWCCDQDGNWDVVEGACVGTPEHKALMGYYDHERWEQNYANYLRHVAETGEDPCGEFTPPPDDRKDEEWEVHVIERGEKVWVTKAGMLGGESYSRPDRLPDYVKEFLLLEKLGDVSASAIDPEHVKGIADLGEDVKWQAGQHRDEWVTTVTIQRSVPSMTDEEWSAKLKEKANAARAIMAFLAFLTDHSQVIDWKD